MALKKIGLLDFGTRIEINSSSGLISSVIKEAIFLERLGFSKIWYGEHYSNSPFDLWSSPDMLIPIIACYTDRINIGIAGTSIRYNNPLKIAKDYTFLSSVFGDRIDVGFAKGKFKQNFEDILNLTNKIIEGPDDREAMNSRIKITTNLISEESNPAKPNVWLLTGSSFGYTQASLLDTNCSRSLFHAGFDLQPDIDRLNRYRETFYKKFDTLPQVNIALAGTCQNKPKVLDKIRRRYSDSNYSSVICGPSSYVLDKLNFYAEQFSVDEVIFYELAFCEFDRRNSLRQLGKMIGK